MLIGFLRRTPAQDPARTGKSLLTRRFGRRTPGFNDGYAASYGRTRRRVFRPSSRPVSAIVDYYGPTDLVAELASKIPFLENWMKGTADPQSMAKRLSPLTYVRVRPAAHTDHPR